jgi:hypothetical protein
MAYPTPFEADSVRRARVAFRHARTHAILGQDVFGHRDSHVTLSELARHRTDKSMQGHGFTEVYDCFFAPLRRSARMILEIGVEQGASLELWRDYFPEARVYGIDLVAKTHLDDSRIRTFVADQANRFQLQAVIDRTGGDFDIILDDGGHSMLQQQVSLGALFPHVKPGGFYVVEDLHTSLRRDDPAFGVDATGANSTLALLSRFMETGRVESKYLTDLEREYLEKNVAHCTLFSRNHEQRSMMGLLRKK